MKRSALNRKTPLSRAGNSLRRSAGLGRGNGLQGGERASLASTGQRRRARRGIRPATPAQRKHAREMGCIVCGPAHDDFTCGPVDPAHVIPRSLLKDGQDEPLAVIGLGRVLHDRYDHNSFDLLPYLERRGRKELAFAVERFGLISTLRRVTNNRRAGE